MKHTKGPWHYTGDTLTHRSFQIYSPYGGVGGRQMHICTTNDLPHSVLVDRDAIEAEANARLIAAAPVMLEALRAIQETANYPENISESALWDLIGKCGEIADAALAKAQGETK